VAEGALRDAAYEGMLNMGVGEDLLVNDLVATIQDVVGHDGPIEHDPSKPDGTPCKLVDTTRMDKLSWSVQTRLHDGIQETYDWYREHEEE
jgi:GDP-L-fucose synthase